MLPVPSTADLAAFSGRVVGTFTAYATEALTQATLLFGLRTGLTAMPTDPDQAMLASNAILQMADRIYLDQPFAELKARPFSSETIGGYSYSVAATKAKDGEATGLFWWDLAMDLLGQIGTGVVDNGSIQQIPTDLFAGSDGSVLLVGPADTINERQIWFG